MHFVSLRLQRNYSLREFLNGQRWIVRTGAT
jgi:hypothetical protein